MVWYFRFVLPKLKNTSNGSGDTWFARKRKKSTKRMNWYFRLVLLEPRDTSLPRKREKIDYTARSKGLVSIPCLSKDSLAIEIPRSRRAVSPRRSERYRKVVLPPSEVFLSWSNDKSNTNGRAVKFVHSVLLFDPWAVHVTSQSPISSLRSVGTLNRDAMLVCQLAVGQTA